KANIDDRIKDLSGACYGMAVTAVENFVKPDLQPQPLAYRLPSLVPVLYAASNGMKSAYWPAISYAALSQDNPAKAAYSSRFDGRDPNSCLQRIQSELDRNGACVVALVQTFRDYSDPFADLLRRNRSPTTTGHALVAYDAVQAPESANWNVYVYDCNYPGDTQKFIHFDTASNKWTYFRGITENHLRPIWHGEAGSPAGEMIVLPAEEVLDYLRPVASTATQMGRIHVNTLGAYTMTDAAGRSAGWDGTSLFNNIPGLTLSPTFSSEPQAVSYLAPESLGDIRIAMDVAPGFQSSLTISNGKSTWKEVDATTASKSESAKLAASLDPEGAITVTGSGQEQMVTVTTSSTVGGTAGALIGVQSVNLPPGATCEISPGVDGRGVSVRSSTDTQYQVTVATESVDTSWVSVTLWTTGGSTQHVDAIPTGQGVPQQLQVGTDADSNGVVDSTTIVSLTQGITAPQGVQVSVQERNAVLTWTPSVSSGSVTGYAVYRSMMPGVESVEPITRLSASVATFTDTALTEGQIYYYSVRAYTGAASPTYSEPSAQVAAVVPDTTAPSLTIQQPQGQIICDTDTVVVAGTATDAGAGVASLTVNGQAVSMSLDGAFSTDVPLVEGANTIAVICTDDAGNVTQVTRTVIRTLGQTATTIVLTIDSTRVSVNGVTQAIDAAPVIRSGRTFVPIRFISETVGAQVTWDAGTQMVGVTLSSHHVELQIGSTRAVVDGAVNMLEAPPFIDHSRTMVPLRLISEAFGAEVSWDPVSRQVTVQYNRPN
ncbi:MAG: stalk domain-containing protein, partial [Caldiserica bacterium]|nr:stalk domain-containing protein [Caldisericota bacterium]